MRVGRGSEGGAGQRVRMERSGRRAGGALWETGPDTGIPRPVPPRFWAQ